jgi:hypothetical protein
MDRIKNKATEKNFDKLAENVGTSHAQVESSGVRKKYQELYEKRQLASVLLESYNESHEITKRNQVTLIHYAISVVKLLLV